MTSPRALALASVLVLPGCYASHTTGGECSDAPSPPPTLGTVDPATLVIEPLAAEVAIDAQGGLPLVAWDGTSWNVAWGDRFALLDGEGLPRGAIEGRGEGGDATAMDVGSCLRGVTAVGERPGESVVAWIGGGGVPEGVTRVPGIDADLARGEDGWWIVSDASSTREGPRLGVFETDAGGTSVAQVRAWISEGSLASPRVVSVTGGAMVSWVDREGIVQRVVGRERASASWRVMTANVWARGAMDTAVLRGRGGAEHVVVAATDGAMVHVALTDPRTRSVIAGPIAVARTTAQHARPSIAPIPELGVIAICVPSGTGPWGGADVIDRVEVVVLDADAAPLARRVDVAAGEQVSAVACAWSGRELMIASWRAGAGIVAQRMRVGPRGGTLPISEPW